MVGRFGLPSCVLLTPMKSMTFMAFVIVLLCYIPLTLGANEREGEHMFDPNLFAKKLVEDFGADGYISAKQVEQLMTSIQKGPLLSETDGAEHEHGPRASNMSEVCQTAPDPQQCISQMCLNADRIFAFHSVGENASADVSEFSAMTPTVLYQLQNPACRAAEPHREPHHSPPAPQVWGFGFLSVSLINICAVVGMVFLPLMKKAFYTQLLMFMVALAVGTLAGSSLLFLIPECFGMAQDDSPFKDVYIWRSTIIMAGVYLFFLTERLLKMIMNYRRIRNHEAKPADVLSTLHATRHHQESMNMSFEPPIKEVHLSENGNLLKDSPDQPNGNVYVAGQTDDKPEQGHIKSVAWMIIFGDGLHNFIDGLSIGAAFAGNIMTGISVSVAVICEELPHELGDFAILLNSGMSMKQALGYNFLSACMCYLGLVTGILVQEMTHGSEWIFAIAGGMFLYISLVDMLPEMNHEAEVGQGENNQLKVFFIQNCGLLVGYGIMLFLANFSGHIDFT